MEDYLESQLATGNQDFLLLCECGHALALASTPLTFWDGKQKALNYSNFIKLEHFEMNINSLNSLCFRTQLA